MEAWKDIVGYEGRYKISNLGRVLSVGRHTMNGTNSGFFKKELILKNTMAGYPRVSLWGGNAKIDIFIHILVATYFIPNPEKKPCVNHKNGNRLDYSLGNLEWSTFSENNQHAYDTGLKVGANRKMVVQIDLSGNTVMVHKSILGASEATGIGRRNIKRNLRGERPTAGGFVWKFIDR